ncbi:hypothetical protein ACRALDRAFT_1059380 [Sodiomyces alcalophilus JCM 7366]|uniref:uncharacterized protein n=1 Tax=Sodiomyces alcalophilus JCM 7366 TaxID=591952 RepID=UPI0039B54B15
MLDENLPTFDFKPSSDSPLHTILYFSHNGSEPAPYYLLMRPDPALPASKNKYAVALTDVSAQSIIYAETLVEPSWSQPSLSTAEIRAQTQNGAPLPATPITPDTVTLDFYNPDAQVVIRTKPGSWGKSDSWEFELPEQSFRAPSASMIDRDAANQQPPVGDVIPKVVFRWKRESRISKEMTCYMTGKSVGGKKSKEPDITVAMFKVRRNRSTVVIYEPNLPRVEVEDRKGLELVLLLSAEVICDLYLNPKNDPFNTGGGGGGGGAAVSSKDGAAAMPSAAAPLRKPIAAASSGVPSTSPLAAAASSPPHPQPPGPDDPRRQEEIDMETKRLQAMVEEEERLAREQERRDEEEARRIRDMLNREEEERRRRAAEVERETERLRRQYGVQSQAYSGPALANNAAASPPLPPRPSPNVGGGGGFSPSMSPTALHTPPLAQRPLSTGPDRLHMSGGIAGWAPPSGAPSSAAGGSGGSRPGKKYSNPLSGLFSRDRDRDRSRERVRGADGPALLRKKSL